MDKTIARGQCLCGAIRFSARLPSKWVAHCHCSRCQRAHGAAFVTWVGMQADCVDIADAGDSLRWFAAPARGERSFCGSCGSSLFFRSAQWPGELHIARAAFTDPVDREPQMHGYFDSHVDWVQLADNLPRKVDPALQRN